MKGCKMRAIGHPEAQMNLQARFDALPTSGRYIAAGRALEAGKDFDGHKITHTTEQWSAFEQAKALMADDRAKQASFNSAHYGPGQAGGGGGGGSGGRGNGRGGGGRNGGGGKVSSGNKGRGGRGRARGGKERARSSRHKCGGRA